MMKKTIFTKSVIIGAVIGGALSLLHKPTREEVVHKVSTASKTIYHYATSPEEMVEKVQDKKQRLLETYETIASDVTFVLDKINEFKEYKNS